MERAYTLAREAEEAGERAVGAVVVLDGRVVGQGRWRVEEGVRQPGRHAVMEALGDVPAGLWERAGAMSCFVTREPCGMCGGALEAYGIGEVKVGGQDALATNGGGQDALATNGGGQDALPTNGGGQDALATNGGGQDALPTNGGGQDALPTNGGGQDAVGTERGLEALSTEARLEAWLEGGNPDKWSLKDARRATADLAERLPVEQLDEVLPYAVALFRKGGYLKDWRALRDYARRAGEPEVLEAVDESLRRELPDVWIRRLLERGDVDGAIGAWFEHEDHSRARHVADELVEAAGDGEVQLLISCRLSRVQYRIGRGSRRHYRKACDILRKLRDELREAGGAEYWRFVIEDLRAQYDNRPALLDELDRAGFE